MHEVARLIVGRGATKGGLESHFTRRYQKHTWLVAARNKGMWDVAVTKRGKARKFRTKNRRSDGQGSTDDDIRAEQIL